MIRKKRILFVNGHLKSGGVEKSLLDILRMIDTEKFDVDLFLLEGYGDYIHELPTEIKVRLIDLHNTYGAFLISVLKCFKKKDWRCLCLRILFVLQTFLGNKILVLSKYLLFGLRKYDCAISFRPGICMDLVANAVTAEKKIGWWHHGTFDLNPLQIKNFIQDCSQLDKLITVSQGCRRLIIDKCPQLESRIQVIPNMINSDNINEKARKFQPYEREANRKIFVTVGRLSPEKHIENVVMAAKKLKKDNRISFHWYIVGEGEEKKRIHDLIISTDTQDVITMLGNQPNPYPYIKYADLLIHTSYVESQCLVVLEAMALRTLCVVTESLGIKEFVVDNGNAILVQQNIKSLIDGIYRAIFDCNDSLIIDNATQTIDTFSSEIIINKIETSLLI